MSPNNFKIFVVEDDLWYREMLTHHLEKNPDYQVEAFETGKALQEALKRSGELPGVVALDYSLPDVDGHELLKKIRRDYPSLPVIIISGQQQVEIALALLREGAREYIVKNDEMLERIWHIIAHIRENHSLKEEIQRLEVATQEKFHFNKLLVGNSAPMQKLFQLMEKACSTNISVSVTGETGTGKEVIANAIHYNSMRKRKPLVALNVAAIPKELVESELFGHEKGAFTGAVGQRIGKFEEADGGTLFLDEIGEMDLDMQAKLLRVLQERTLSRVGGNKKVKFDIRLIVATHKNLAQEVKKGNFRQDLYYRLLGLPLEIPPLRERGKDIILLAETFLKTFCKENKMPLISLAESAKHKLMKYSYPGNVRELKAVIELAAVLAPGEQIEAQDIDFNEIDPLDDMLKEEDTLQNYTRRIIRHYLSQYDDNVLLVAKKLNIGKSTIYRMLQNKEI